MAWPKLERSRRCVRMARNVWLATLVWFLVALLASVGWLGPGSAFLAWSMPAIVLAVLTWKWLRAIGASLSKGQVAVGLVIWGALAAAAWDGGDQWVPEWSFAAFGILLL